MPVNIPVQVTLSANGSAIAGLTWTNADLAEGNEFLNSGEEVVIIRNTTAGSRTVTFVSVPDPFGRLGNLAVVVAAGGVAFAGPFKPGIWSTAQGRVELTVSADVTFAVVRPLR